MVGICQRLQAKTIRCRAVEDYEDVNIIAEVLFEFADGRGSVRIIAVADDMANISLGDGLQDVGVDASIVVAGKTTRGFHGATM